MILPHDPKPTRDDDEPSEPGSESVHPDVDGAGPQAVEAPRPDGEDAVGWAPFDPGDAPELPVSEDGSGRVVAVIASVELVGVGWAVSVATELARVWAAQRPGVVLVDTDLARPRLHHAVRVDNSVGLAEVLRGEAPVGSATRVVDEEHLFCVPAGNAPEDPELGFDRTRWSRLCEAFSGAGVTVVAYVPASATWIRDVLGTATDVVQLTEQHRSLDWPREGAPPVRAVLGPMPLVRPPSDPTGRSRSGSPPLLGFDMDPDEEDGEDLDEDLAPAKDERTDVGGASVGGASVGDLSVDGVPSGVGAGGTDAVTVGPTAPARSTSARRGRGRSHTPATVLALILVLALGAWAAIRLGTGAPPSAEAVGSSGPPASGDVGPATVAPRPVPPNADFSVAVASYTNPDGAEQRRATLASVVPELPWFVAPVELDGVAYHRVMGGLVADSSAALALGAELAREGSGGIGEWIARPSGWVLDFGEHKDRATAEQELERIRSEGIPAQLAEIRFTDQTVRYRIYAGGYRDAAEASYLASVAEASGLSARPARRMGRPRG